jgi:hypothetical protein
MTLTIDPEFRDLIQPLTDEEKTELEASLKSSGCRDTLVCWGDTLLDGHNRYEICNRLSIPYATKPVALKDRDAAKEWIITNQLARRNLEKYQRARLRLVRDAIYKAQGKERQREHGGTTPGKSKESLLHHGGEVKAEDNWTDHKLAKEAGVSHKFIHQVRIIENEGSPETRELLKQGKTTVNREYNKIRKPTEKPRASKQERIEKIRELSGKGFKADQIAPEVGISEERVRFLARESEIILPDVAIGGVRKIDVNRIIEQTVMVAQSFIVGLDLVDSRIDEIDSSKTEDWINTISQSITVLKRLISQLKKRGINNEQ